MAITDALRQDHQVIREQLERLEGILEASRARGAILTLCHSLARLVEGHMQREEEALAPYAHRLQPAIRQRTLYEHADERPMLRDLNALLSEGIRVPRGALISHVLRFASWMRAHMDMEELSVFPVVEQAEQALHGRAQPEEAREQVPTPGGTP